MRYLSLLLVLVSTLSFAKDHEWKKAKVLDTVVTEGGTSAAVVPIGTALYGVSVPNRQAYYIIRIDNVQYRIHNYSDGKMVYKWLLLTVGGETEAYVDGNKLHIKDTEGRDRKCKILAQWIAN